MIRQRRKMVSIRYSDNEFEAVKGAAEQSGVSLSDHIRSLTIPRLVKGWGPGQKLIIDGVSVRVIGRIPWLTNLYAVMNEAGETFTVEYGATYDFV